MLPLDSAETIELPVKIQTRAAAVGARTGILMGALCALGPSWAERPVILLAGAEQEIHRRPRLMTASSRTST